MADKEHALAVLGNTERGCIKHIPFTVIPDFIQRNLGGKEVVAPVAGEKAANIFSEQPFGSSVFGQRFDELKDGEEQAASFSTESLSRSCNGQVLAREAECPDMGLWHQTGVDGSDVIGRPLSFRLKDGAVGASRKFVALHEPDARHARVLQSAAHAANASEQVEKSQWNGNPLLGLRKNGGVSVMFRMSEDAGCGDDINDLASSWILFRTYICGIVTWTTGSATSAVAITVYDPLIAVVITKAGSG